MIDKKNVEAWCEALESGDYAQGHGGLRVHLDEDTSGYCCLGVLCDVSGLGEWVHSPSIGFRYKTDEGEMGGYINREIAKWLGVADEDLHINSYTEDKKTFYDIRLIAPKNLAKVAYLPASSLNDSIHLPFQEIAEAIRATFLED